jgi:hypothetical protein
MFVGSVEVCELIKMHKFKNMEVIIGNKFVLLTYV